MFLAQCAHESGAFKHLEENLNYSATGLRATFPKYFPTEDIANTYARKPEFIASRVYAGRMGNGSEDSRDGWKFRGRGLIQLTGRSNYSACSQEILQDLTLLTKPELLTEPACAALSAAWFFDSHGCTKLSDMDDEQALVAVTKKINGGVMGLDDRREWWQRAKRIIN